MKIRHVIFILLFPVLSVAHPGEVLSSIEAPSGFTTGLTWDGTALWVADYKTDKLSRIDPSNGNVIREIPSPGFWPAGLAWDGQALWNVDQNRRRIFRVDPESGRILFELEAPSSNPTGLTWDGNTLWLADGKANKIMKLDLSDGTAIRSLDGPLKSPQGLAFDGKYLWCSDRTGDEIYMIDPENGDVIMILDAPGPYSRGLTWDEQNIWNTDYQKDRIYKLVQHDTSLFSLSDTRKARITVTHEVKGYGSGLIRELETYLAIPENLPQQKIQSIRFSPHRFKKEHDHWNQPIALFKWQDIASHTTVQTTMIIDAEISKIRYYIDPDRCGSLDDIPEGVRTPYTTDGSKYRINDPFMQKTVKAIVGKETNPYWIGRRIFDYVGRTLEYKLEGGWNVAPFVLQRGTGSCSEYSFSFIALCRAAGLPARYVGAIVVRGDDASLDDVFHRWPEIYLPNYGWIPIDPQGGDKPLPRDKANNIGGLSNRFLITTQGGGDSEYLGWYYNYNQKYTTDPQVQVNVEVFGEWEPLDE